MAMYTKQFPETHGGINLTKRMAAQRARETDPPKGWTKHTSYHWSMQLCGKRLDFWPSKDKWQYDGKVYPYGDVDEFIAHIKTTKELP